MTNVSNIYLTDNYPTFRRAGAELNHAAELLRIAKDNHAQAQRKVQFIEAAHSANYSHARAENFMGKPSSIRIYQKDPTSPTNVTLAASWHFDEAVTILDAAERSFPLSPTEGLRFKMSHGPDGDLRMSRQK